MILEKFLKPILENMTIWHLIVTVLMSFCVTVIVVICLSVTDDTVITLVALTSIVISYLYVQRVSKILTSKEKDFEKLN